MFWKPTVAVQADVGSTMVALAKGLRGYKCDPDWLPLLRSRDDDKEKKNRYRAPRRHLSAASKM